MSEVNIGQEISKIRKKQGLSIRELAQQAKVTPSLLSQIERGIANPSVNSLKTIASVLNVPLFTFFMSEVSHKDLVVRKDSRKKIILPGSENVVYEILLKDNDDNLEFAIMNLQPQTSSCEDYISHKGYEIAYVLEGSVNLYIDDTKLELNEGDSIKIMSRTNHRWENEYKTMARVIFAVIL